jgi:hypothetical protein
MTDVERELRGLATLLLLEKEARHAETLERLGFVIVNDTHELIRYHQAVLWRRPASGKPEILAFSGLANPDTHSPFYIWIKSFLDLVSRKERAPALQLLTASDLPEGLRDGWHEWMPGPVLWCPLVAPGGRWLGGLMLSRKEPWQPGEGKLLERLVDAYAHAWNGLERTTPGPRERLGTLVRSSRNRLIALGFLIALLVLPVRESALGPAEVTPVEPEVASSPVEGVVRKIAVEPNAVVRRGDLLFSLDDTQVRNRYEIAKRGLAVAEADYLRATQKAFTDPKSKSELALLKAKAKEKQAEADYTADLLARMQVRASRDGIAVFSDPSDWIGRPVVVGQRVMLIADPARSELEIRLPVEDAINLEPGAEVLFFMNIRPAEPLTARLSRTSYEAQSVPGGALAFRLKARFDAAESPPRIGLKGSAKVYGERVSLFYYLMRRPLAVLRRMAGI